MLPDVWTDWLRFIRLQQSETHTLTNEATKGIYGPTSLQSWRGWFDRRSKQCHRDLPLKWMPFSIYAGSQAHATTTRRPVGKRDCFLIFQAKALTKDFVSPDCSSWGMCSSPSQSLKLEEWNVLESSSLDMCNRRWKYSTNKSHGLNVEKESFPPKQNYNLLSWEGAADVGWEISHTGVGKEVARVTRDHGQGPEGLSADLGNCMWYP